MVVRTQAIFAAADVNPSFAQLGLEPGGFLRISAVEAMGCVADAIGKVNMLVPLLGAARPSNHDAVIPHTIPNNIDEAGPAGSVEPTFASVVQRAGCLDTSAGVEANAGLKEPRLCTLLRNCRGCRLGSQESTAAERTPN